jgi:predicted SAM-dependent methyltransferase
VLEHVSYTDAINVVQERFRTLRPGSWLRICVPDLAKYVRYYCGELDDARFLWFPHRTLQMQMHRSAWDVDLILTVLREIGFATAAAVEFGQGTDQRLVCDEAGKPKERLYGEARKPGM